MEDVYAKTLLICALTLLITTSSAIDLCPEPCKCGDIEVECNGDVLPVSSFFASDELPADFTTIKYDRCELTSLSDRLTYIQVTSLTVLRSGVCNISDEAFADMARLKTLDLRYNLITSLSTDVFSGLRALENLYLGHNRLRSFADGFFPNLPSLVYLQLDGNTDFLFRPYAFGNISSSFQHFSCEYCRLDPEPDGLLSIEESLGNDARYLKELTLSNNYMNPLSTFETMPLLEILRLENCSIKDVNERTFQSLANLKRLYLRSNRIKHLPSDALNGSFQTLRVVSLKGNLLESLDVKLLPWSSLDELDLEDNPWKCGCDLEWMHLVNLQMDRFKNATCSAPEEFADQSVTRFLSGCHLVDYRRNTSAVVLGIVIPIIIICVVVIACFCFRFVKTVLVRRRRARENRSFRYSAVYKETVEPMARTSMTPKSRTTQDSML